MASNMSRDLLNCIINYIYLYVSINSLKKNRTQNKYMFDYDYDSLCIFLNKDSKTPKIKAVDLLILTDFKF